MKKFITLIFFAGFLSTGFAQYHAQDYNNQPSGNGYSQSQNYGGNHGDQYSQNGYRNGSYNNGNRDKDYGYNNDRDRNDYRERGRWGRDERWRGRDRFQPGFDDHYYRPRHRGFLQIRIW